MSSFNGRLKEFIKQSGLNNNSFSSKIGVHAQMLANITGPRQSKPGTDFLEKVLNHFPELNIEWLLIGKGEMFKSHADQEELMELKDENERLKKRLKLAESERTKLIDAINLMESIVNREPGNKDTN